MSEVTPSLAYVAGQNAKKANVPILHSAIRVLRPGTQQYEDFIAGYDGIHWRGLSSDQSKRKELK